MLKNVSLVMYTHSLPDVPKMKVVEELAESRDALHGKVRQVGALGKCESAELGCIVDEMVNILICQCCTACEVHNAELIEGDCNGANEGWVHRGWTRRKSGARLWRWDIDQMPWVGAEVVEQGRVLYARQLLEIRDCTRGNGLVVVHLELSQDFGVQEDADGRVVCQLRHPSKIEL